MQTFWHSSAHVLGEALESCFGAQLTIGPALEEGFYYDCYLGERTLTEADKAALEKRIQEVCSIEAVTNDDLIPYQPFEVYLLCKLSGVPAQGSSLHARGILPTRSCAGIDNSSDSRT